MVFAANATEPVKDMTLEMDEQHKACLEKIAVNSDEAYEDAMIWRGDGGGRRARHCEAMALFALGHKEEAAHRLDLLGGMVGQLSPQMRKNYYLEAANFWLMAGETQQAYESASKGLEIDEKDVGLRIARARVYALLNRYKDSETDLTSALVFEPENVDALRYRADARHKLGKLDLAKIDIDRAMMKTPSVESALIRGHIVEALRLRTEAETFAGPVEEVSSASSVDVATQIGANQTLTGHEFLSVIPDGETETIGTLKDSLIVPDIAKERPAKTE